MGVVVIGREEVRGVVSSAEMLPLTVGDHRRELVEVTDQHQLDSAEPFPRAWAKSLQGDGQAVEQISPDHRGLIDDQSVEFGAATTTLRLVAARN